MIAKAAVYLAGVLVPFIPKGPIRGDRAYEPRLPSSMPVEGLGPFPEAVSLGSEDSPRLDLPLATVTNDQPVAPMTDMPAKSTSIDVGALARIPDIHAVEFFILLALRTCYGYSVP